MKFIIKHAISVLLVILLINKINAQLQLANHLTKVNKLLKSNNEELETGLETHIDQLSQNPNDWEYYAKIATGIATAIIPQPMGLVVGLVSSTFFNLYDVELERKASKLQQLHNQEKQLFEQNLLSKLDKVSRDISIESSNIIQTIEKEIAGVHNHMDNIAEKIIDTLKNVVYGQTSFYDLRNVLNYLNVFYKENIDCLLKSECLPQVRQELFNTLILRGQEFRTRLSTFVTQFIYTTEILPTSIDRVPGFFTYLLEEYKQRTRERRDCDIETEQSEIYRLYAIIILTLQKSYSMVVAAHMIRYRENISNKTLSAQYLMTAVKVLQTSNNDADIVTKIVNIAMEKASTEIRRCDPIKHEKGKTYDRFVYIDTTYTGYTYNRYYIKSNNSYVYVDNSLQRVEYLGLNPDSYDGIYGLTNQGYLRLNSKCEIYHDVADITHYYDLLDSERLYHHFDFTYKNGSQKTFGKLAKDNQVFHSVTFKYPYTILDNYCQSSFCPSPVETCQTEIPDNAIRHISLVAVNASSGHVITGIRWKIKDKILYFEIQEGKYIKGKVVSDTIYWKKTPTHEISNSKTVAIGKNSAKGFMMNDAHLPTDYMLSGVQFVWNKKIRQGSDLVRIKIFGKRLFKKKSLNINLELPSWQENIMRLPLDCADASEYSNQNIILSKPGEHFVHFQQSDMKKDASQSSIPYLDIQPVVSNPPQALQGLGLYYKGTYGYGGFIGLRGFITDLKKQVNPNLIQNYGHTINIIIEDLKKLTSLA